MVVVVDAEVVAEVVAELAILIEEGREDEAARLITDDLRGTEELSNEDRARIAAEITAWLFDPA